MGNPPGGRGSLSWVALSGNAAGSGSPWHLSPLSLQLWKSDDFGQTWIMIQEHVKSFSWYVSWLCVPPGSRPLPPFFRCAKVLPVPSRHPVAAQGPSWWQSCWAPAFFFPGHQSFLQQGSFTGVPGQHRTLPILIPISVVSPHTSQHANLPFNLDFHLLSSGSHQKGQRLTNRACEVSEPIIPGLELTRKIGNTERCGNFRRQTHLGKHCRCVPRAVPGPSSFHRAPLGTAQPPPP